MKLGPYELGYNDTNQGIDKQQLRNEYLSGVGTKMLAKRFGVSRETVRWQLRKMGILGAKGRQWKTGRPRLNLDCEELKKQYLSGKSVNGLAREYGCSQDTIRDRLLSSGVEIESNRLNLDDERIRELYASGTSVIELCRQFGCSDKTIRSRLDDVTKEARRQADARRKEEELYDLEQKRVAVEKHEAELAERAETLYLSGLSIRKVTQELGCIQSFVVKALNTAGIERRTMAEYCQDPEYLGKVSVGLKKAHERGCYTEETHQKISGSLQGDKAPNWRGGISFEPYPPEFNRQLKRYVRKRDDHTCATCHEPNSNCVHHIDYDKQNNSPTNLITLCPSCHSKSGGNRRFWQIVLAPIAHRRESIPLSVKNPIL